MLEFCLASNQVGIPLVTGFSLFCTPSTLNLLAFKFFRTLSQKQPGWGQKSVTPNLFERWPERWPESRTD